MTRGGPGSATELVSVYIQRIGFRVFDQGMASAQADRPADPGDDPIPPLRQIRLQGDLKLMATKRFQSGKRAETRECPALSWPLLLVLIVCVFPFYWMVTASFKSAA